jgi:hypothetical protein
MIDKFLLAFAVMTTPALTGCGLLSKACDSAMPLIQKAQIYGDDAAASLATAQLILESIPMVEVDRHEADAAIMQARNGIRIAQAALLTAQDSCSGVDALLVFKDFINAWGLVERLLSKHSEQLSSGAKPSAFAPLIVQKASK